MDKTTIELVTSLNPQESIVYSFVMDRMVNKDLTLGEVKELIYEIKDYCQDYNNFQKKYDDTLRDFVETNPFLNGEYLK